MKTEQCPKCKSKDVTEIEIMEFDPGNIFGFSEADYASQKDRRCNSCHHEWRAAEVAKKKKKYLDKDLQGMPLSRIADIILNDWKDINYSAFPYVEAMLNLEEVSDFYGDNDGRTIIVYFLSNAGSWKGETARLVKKHLRDITGQ